MSQYFLCVVENSEKCNEYEMCGCTEDIYAFFFQSTFSGTHFWQSVHSDLRIVEKNTVTDIFDLSPSTELFDVLNRFSWLMKVNALSQNMLVMTTFSNNELRGNFTFHLYWIVFVTISRKILKTLFLKNVAMRQLI